MSKTKSSLAEKVLSVLKNGKMLTAQEIADRANIKGKQRTFICSLLVKMQNRDLVSAWENGEPCSVTGREVTRWKRA